jgi:hypothetical protein
MLAASDCLFSGFNRSRGIGVIRIFSVVNVINIGER